LKTAALSRSNKNPSTKKNVVGDDAERELTTEWQIDKRTAPVNLSPDNNEPL
jgi:hypothetical protein